nr:hypothetical protein CFP56_02565 [Quercus suber]
MRKTVTGEAEAVEEKSLEARPSWLSPFPPGGRSAGSYGAGQRVLAVGQRCWQRRGREDGHETGTSEEVISNEVLLDEFSSPPSHVATPTVDPRPDQPTRHGFFHLRGQGEACERRGCPSLHSSVVARRHMSGGRSPHARYVPTTTRRHGDTAVWGRWAIDWLDGRHILQLAAALSCSSPSRTVPDDESDSGAIHGDAGVRG